MTTLISRKSMLATAVLGALFWLGVRAFAADASACNRHCLLEILTTYTEALTDNDTSRLHVSSNVRVTGNGVVTRLGKGHGAAAGSSRQRGSHSDFISNGLRVP